MGTLSSLQRRHSGGMSGPRIQSPEASAAGEMRTPWNPCSVSADKWSGAGGIFGVDAADALKCAGITLENAEEIGVVPLVVNDLDNDGACDAVGMHQTEEFFGRGVFSGWMCTGREGELRIVLEDMNVRIDHSVVLGLG